MRKRVFAYVCVYSDDVEQVRVNRQVLDVHLPYIDKNAEFSSILFIKHVFRVALTQRGIIEVNVTCPSNGIILGRICSTRSVKNFECYLAGNGMHRFVSLKYVKFLFNIY